MVTVEAPKKFLESPFYQSAVGRLRLHNDLLERPAEDIVVSVLPLLDKGEFNGLTLYLLGTSVEDSFDDLKRGVSREDFLNWVDRNPEGFRLDWGGELYKAFAAGINAAAASLDEAARIELRLDSVSYRKGIAAFYHAISLEDHEHAGGFTPLQVASWRIENFFEEVFNHYQAGLTDKAVHAFWEYFGLEMAPGYHPAVWW